MASLPLKSPNCSIFCERGTISIMGVSALPSLQQRVRAVGGLMRGQLGSLASSVNNLSFRFELT